MERMNALLHLLSRNASTLYVALSVVWSRRGKGEYPVSGFGIASFSEFYKLPQPIEKTDTVRARQKNCSEKEADLIH